MISRYYSPSVESPMDLIKKTRDGAWIVATTPDDGELDQLADEFSLDRDLLVDAIDIYEAPRLERDNGNVYVYTRYCYPEGKEVATEPLLVILTDSNLITVMRTDSEILTGFTSGRVNALTTRRAHLMVQIMEAINYSYEKQLNKVSKQILRTRSQLRQSQISNRAFIGIIELEEDLNEFLGALQPQGILLTALMSSKYIRWSEEDKEMIEDLRLGTNELIELTKSRLRTLTNIRQAYDAIATNNLNNTFKRLTSIAIFLTIPTIVGGLFGMNVPIPWQHHQHAFSYVMGIIVVLMVLTIWFFKRRRWV